MKKKGFTLVELLVVIAIIALLMGILMPALSKVKQNAYRLVCGTNLKAIGSGIMVYTNNFQEQYPRAGTSQSTWGPNVMYNAASYSQAFASGNATITSSFYLLIKYCDVTPKIFLCKSDSDVSEFEVEGIDAGRLTQFFDFGPSSQARNHVSFSYHNPFGSYRLRTGSESTMAVAADKTPYVETDNQTPKIIANFNPDGNNEAIMAGNSYSHQSEGQNVLFLDNSVRFENTPSCGSNEDNIYTRWASLDMKKGTPVTAFSTQGPAGRTDSLLVNDGPASAAGGGQTKTGRDACFLGDTPVWTNNGFVQISDVAVGQFVGQSAAVELLQVHEGTYSCYDLTLSSGESISVVSNHLFLTQSGLWVTAPNLRTGMKLATQNGSVEIMNIANRTYTGKVYNVKVHDSERYMVGNDMVIVRDW